jgi:threonylcarbamoyladenosine tRNA methylthiotransferase MtaB
VEFSQNLIDAFGEVPKLANYVHLPVQSGDDEVLARMNRPYRTRDFRALVDRLRARVEDPAITTDIIAGFPGETEEAHARSVAFVRETGFARVHAFPFSPRPGTAAAGMPHDPGTEIARRRTAELIDAGREMARACRRRFVGKTVEVLAEPGAETGDEAGRLAGYTGRYVRVTFVGPDDLVGRLVRVRLLAETEGQLAGELAGGREAEGNSTR